MEERQEIYCHNCDTYVQFTIDLSLNGNHVLECPKCKHEHCRVVRDGIITADRWDQHNGPTILVSSGTITMSTSSTSITINYSAWTGDSWTNKTATTSSGNW